MTFDFHTHSFFSDGVLSPIELIRRAHVAGYRAIAVTDHVGLANIEQVIREVSRDCLLAEKHWGIKALPGVELTFASFLRPASALISDDFPTLERPARAICASGSDMSCSRVYAVVSRVRTGFMINLM